MSEVVQVVPQKTAGFVNRGYNHAKRKASMEAEEKEIARLEALQRGEEVSDEEEEEESDSTGTETTKVQTKGSSKQEEESDGEAQEDDTNLSAEEKSFKKRYGDVRRHMAEKEKEYKEKIARLEERLEKGDRAVRPPKSDEDIEAWANKYPDVAGIVETIAAKKAKELFAKAESRLLEIDKAEEQAKRLRAETAIRKSHEDFDELRDSDDFHNWAGEQPKWVQDALYENSDDAASVVRVIDLYKVDKGLTKAASKAGTKAAASSVSRGTRSKVDVEGTASHIKESDVAKMSAAEFEKRADEITEAMRNGKFIYDISGSAR